MVDVFRDALLTPQQAARHLRIPESTVYQWMRERAGYEVMVHSVEPVRQGWPRLPFAAVIEAYVLRSLRDMHLGMSKIRAAVAEVRDQFGTPYGLATKRIATDGIDVFVHYLDPDDLARAGDRQRPIREVIQDHLRYITWGSDNNPVRLTLRQYGVAPVVIDPRFAWGEPVVESTKVPVEAIVGLWKAGETFETVAGEYGLEREQVEAIVRADAAA
jgi:uncharacterized protein (DUF433 family)